VGKWNEETDRKHNRPEAVQMGFVMLGDNKPHVSCCCPMNTLYALEQRSANPARQLHKAIAEAMKLHTERVCDRLIDQYGMEGEVENIMLSAIDRVKTLNKPKSEIDSMVRDIIKCFNTTHVRKIRNEVGVFVKKEILHKTTSSARPITPRLTLLRNIMGAVLKPVHNKLYKLEYFTKGLTNDQIAVKFINKVTKCEYTLEADYSSYDAT